MSIDSTIEFDLSGSRTYSFTGQVPDGRDNDSVLEPSWQTRRNEISHRALENRPSDACSEEDRFIEYQ